MPNTPPNITPGPWTAHLEDDSDSIFANAEDHPVVIAFANTDQKKWEQNILLLAAAPELYDALQETVAYINLFVKVMGGKKDSEESVRKALKALRKAEGKY